MSPTLRLYYAPNACSLVPYVTLTEAGAAFEVINLNFGKGQHLSPEYLRLNPKHKVPVLLIDGVPLTENVAIQIWIARAFPQAKLLPSDPMQEIRAMSLMAWCASGIHPALTPNVLPQQFCDLPGSEDSVRRCAQKKLLENFQIADELLQGRDWFFDHFTAVDAYFFGVFAAPSSLAWMSVGLAIALRTKPAWATARACKNSLPTRPACWRPSRPPPPDAKPVLQCDNFQVETAGAHSLNHPPIR